MSKTPSELATAVLVRLGVIGPGDTPSAPRSQQVQSFYANFFQQLEYQDLAFWDQEAIDERVFQALVDTIAGRGAGVKAWVRDPDLEASGMQAIRILAAEVPTGAIAKNTYY